MPKRATTFDLTLPQRTSQIPAYRWLYDSLRSAILQGQLRPGLRLPGTRDFARQYRLSRGTVVAAFEQLKSEGYVQGTVGSGTYVSSTLPDDLLRVASAAPARASTAQPAHRRLSLYAKRLQPFPNFRVRPSRAFRANLPALDLFPIALWARLTAQSLRRASMNSLLACDALGHQPLRQAVADYLNTARGARCTPEQVAIVSGVQEALDLTARILLDPRDRVCMENPGYVGATKVFDAIGVKVSALSVDDQGMKVHPSALRGTRLIYATPAHQFPLGVTMSLARRLALLESARKFRIPIFEDDYDSEYRYSGRPIPALQGLDHHGLVLLAGSFSKVMFPSLRIGYLVIPEDLVDRFAAALSITSRHAPLLPQAVLCEFITAGHFGRHLRRMRQIYAERLSVLLESAKQHLAGLLEISSIEAGLQTIAWLPKGLDAETVAKTASARHVEVIPLSRYSRTPLPREGLQLGFAAFDTREIHRGVRDLAAVLAQEIRKTGSN